MSSNELHFKMGVCFTHSFHWLRELPTQLTLIRYKSGPNPRISFHFSVQSSQSSNVEGWIFMNCMPMFVGLSIGYLASFEVPLHSSHAPLAKAHICPLLPEDWSHLLHFIGPLLAAQSLVNKATQAYLDKTCLPKWHKISNLVWKHFCARLISKQNRRSGKSWVHCDAFNS